MDQKHTYYYTTDEINVGGPLVLADILKEVPDRELEALQLCRREDNKWFFFHEMGQDFLTENDVVAAKGGTIACGAVVIIGLILLFVYILKTVIIHL